MTDRTELPSFFYDGPPEPLAAPKSVRGAFWLWIAFAVISVVHVVVDMWLGRDAIRDAAIENARTQGFNPAESDLDGMVATAQGLWIGFTAAFACLIGYLAVKMRSGSNWARITLTVVGAAGTVYAMIFLAGGTTAALVTAVARIGIAIGALWLMFGHSANRYFGDVK
ncbi:MAG TPA: hypothetical protein VM677_12715 [Actinokineospora sp.]|nr:hypothetical protein [Actinokineospora sp.]